MAITEKYVSDAGAGAHDGSSEANAFSWAEMVTDINATGKAGNRYNVKGNITRGASDTISSGGSSTSPVVIRGYASTITDGYQGRTNSNGPLVTTNLPVVTYGSTFLLNVSGTFVVIESLKIVGVRSGAVVALTGGDNAITRSVVENSSTNAAAVALALGAGRATAFDCDIALTGASGGNEAVTVTSSGMLIACRVTGGPANGVSINGSAGIVVDNLIYDCGGIGIEILTTTLTGLVYGNTVVDCAGNCIDLITATTVLVRMMNNLATDSSGGYGIDGNSAANAIFAANNRLDRNASGGTTLATDWLSATSYNHNTTNEATQGNEYIDPSTADYRLESASPAKAAGMFPFRDIGALQREEPAGGGGGIIRPVSMSGGFV